MKVGVRKTEDPFKQKLSEAPLSRVNLCYQCKKCSCGCPVSFDMDLLPHQLMRLLQLGEIQTVLRSRTIWICASCQTCTTRCPNDIDIAGVIDRCRHSAAAEGEVSQKNIELFHKIFLNQIRRLGRIHELSMLGKYKLLSGQLLTDIPLGAKMLAMGKLKILPNRIKGRQALQRLFTEGEQKP